MKYKTLALAILGATVYQAFAFAGPATGAYVGGGIGESESRDFDEVESEAMKLFGGVRITENLALEAEWIRLDDFEVDGDNAGSIESDSLNLSAVLLMPLTQEFELLAKGGVHYTDIEFSSSADSDESGISLGLGGAYHFTPSFGVRAEYQRLYNVTDFNDDFDLYAVGFTYSF